MGGQQTRKRREESLKSAEKAIKSVAKLFRKTLKQTYIVDQDYSQYLSDLLDQVVSYTDKKVNVNDSIQELDHKDIVIV